MIRLGQDVTHGQLRMLPFFRTFAFGDILEYDHRSHYATLFSNRAGDVFNRKCLSIEPEKFIILNAMDGPITEGGVEREGG